MAYSDKVIDHFENPRNVGSLDKNDPNVGTGIVGAPACGDVMKLQIKVNEDGIIEDAKFKTYGCFVSNTYINTPTKETKISDLNVGDEVLAWNGKKIIKNKIKKIIKKQVAREDLLVVTFQRDENRRNLKAGKFNLICTKEHVFWNANDEPILAKDLKSNDELYEITENELRILTNIRHRKDFKKFLSKQMKNINKKIDHKKLPQNQKGYVFKNLEQKKERNRIASLKNWKSETYRKNWQKGMSNIDYSKPTNIELKFIKFFNKHNIPLTWVAGKKWITTEKGSVSPDFILEGTKKCVEVYTKNMPKFMQDRSDSSNYVKDRTALFESAGYKCICLSIENMNDLLLPKINNFIHNGMKVVDVQPIKNGNSLRGSEKDENGVWVYDLVLEDGAHVYFSKRVGSHNCGSALASSSLVTEYLKGISLEKAEEIKNTDIADELALPPVKIHCSILAEDAVKAAIEDYRNKKK